jgi:hypothetical protein
VRDTTWYCFTRYSSYIHVYCIVYLLSFINFSREGLLHMYYFIFLVHNLFHLLLSQNLYGFITLKKTQCKEN